MNVRLWELCLLDMLMKWDTNLNSLVHSLDPNPLYQVARRLDDITRGSRAPIVRWIFRAPLDPDSQVEGRE